MRRRRLYDLLSLRLIIVKLAHRYIADVVAQHAIFVCVYFSISLLLKENRQDEYSQRQQ